MRDRPKLMLHHALPSKRFSTWRAKDWDEDTQASGPTVWLDRAHLAVVGGTETASVYIVDFSSVLDR